MYCVCLDWALKIVLRIFFYLSKNLTYSSYSCLGEKSRNSFIEFVINNKMDFTNSNLSDNIIRPQTLIIKVFLA